MFIEWGGNKLKHKVGLEIDKVGIVGKVLVVRVEVWGSIIKVVVVMLKLL